MRSSNHLYGCDGVTTLIALPVHSPVSPDLHLKKLTQGVDNGYSDPMESAGNLVGLIVELPARMEFGHHHFNGWDSLFLVNIHRDSASVVVYCHGVIRVNTYVDPSAEARESLINTVIHDFEDEVMKSLGREVPDIHGRPLSDGSQPFQYRYSAGVVLIFWSFGGVLEFIHRIPPDRIAYSPNL